MKISRIERASFATGLFTIDCPDCKIVLEFDLGHFHFADFYFLDITVYLGESNIPHDRIIEVETEMVEFVISTPTQENSIWELMQAY